MTALLDVRTALSTLLGAYLGTYTLANGSTTPAIAVRAVGEPRKTGTIVTGVELIIERDPDLIQVQTQGQSPSLYEWTIWLVSWDETSLAVPASLVVAAFPNVETEPVRVEEGSGPSNQLRIRLQTGERVSAPTLPPPPASLTAIDRTITIPGPVAGDRFPISRVPSDVLLASVVATVEGFGPSVTFQLFQGADLFDSGTAITNSTTITNTTAGASVGMTQPLVLAGRHVWIEITAVSGVVEVLTITLTATTS